MSAGELMRAVLSTNYVKAQQKWYVAEINFTAAQPVGTEMETNVQFRTEGYFLWTNTYVITAQAPFDNNATSVLPRHPYTRINFFRSNGQNESSLTKVELEFPFSINNASTKTDYTLFNPGDRLNIRARSNYIQVEMLTTITLEGIEYLY